ncbi:putative membrane protein [Pseudomonas sp. CCOS 191]|nr:putative membrane protein [Pseudomonas sp. CCOS 191]
MATIWLFNSTSCSGYKPAISGQLLSVSENTLCLRNPWVSDSIFMGKLYCAMTIASVFIFYFILLSNGNWKDYARAPTLMIGMALSPFIFLPFLFYRVWLIKGLSSVCFNRVTKKSTTNVLGGHSSLNGTIPEVVFSSAQSLVAHLSPPPMHSHSHPVEKTEVSIKKIASGPTVTNPQNPASSTSPKSGNTFASS